MAIDYCILSKKLFEALGHVIDQIDCDTFCEQNVEGILLPYGDHVITVRLENKPTEVYVSVTDEGLPVCSGDISTVGVTIQDAGFVLYAHIRTNQGLVKWVIQ